MASFRKILLIPAAFVLCGAALAAPPVIISHAPGQNDLDIAESSPIVIIFDSEIDPATISDETIIVSGNYSGRIPGTLAIEQPMGLVQYLPSEPYMPGETITVTASSGIKSITGESFAGYGFQFTVSVAEGWEGITYRSSYPDREGLSFINVADLHEDRDLDIVTGIFFHGSRLLTNDGAGEFTQSYFPVSGWTTQLSDMNYNGLMDVVNSFPYYEKGMGLHGEVELKYCNALGEYDYRVRLQYPLSFNSRTADFDNDGLMDVCTFGLVDSAIFWFSNGDSTFTGYSPGIGTHHYGVAADMDNDGLFDIVFNNAQVFHNNGDRTFTMTSLSGLPPEADREYTHLVDINGDSYLDVLWAYDNADIVQPFLNNGSGVFAPGFEYEVAGRPQFITSGDMDGDGDMDIIVSSVETTTAGSSYFLTVLFNYGNGIMLDADEYELAHNDAKTPVTGDFNSDGRLDIAAYNFVDQRLSIFWNSDIVAVCGDVNADEMLNVGDPVYLVNHIFKFGPGPEPVERGDVNCDYGINVGDVVYLLHYIFDDGPPPCCY